MNKQLLLRRLGILLGVGLVVGAVWLSQRLAEEKPAPPRKEQAGTAPRVATFQAEVQEVMNTLGVQGQLIAFDKIDIFSEVTGALLSTSRPFKVGTYFPKGSVLIKIDNSEARLSLLAQKSSFLNAVTQVMPDLKVDYPESFKHWQTYLNQFDPEAPITALPEPLRSKRLSAA